jgi:hypothetical protein
MCQFQKLRMDDLMLRTTLFQEEVFGDMESTDVVQDSSTKDGL